jgi:hypothetical protein
MPTATPGAALFIGEGTDSGLFGRWFNIDPKIAASQVVPAHIDKAIADVINVGFIPPSVEKESAGTVSTMTKEYVEQYIRDHPGVHSSEVSRVTGVPASTVRRWINATK